MLSRVSSLMVVLAGMLVLSCSELPTAELEIAEQAVLAAQNAEAEQYAPEIYREALDTLNFAKAAIAEQSGRFAILRSYSKSRSLLASAERLATDAVSQAVEEKEQVKAETYQQLESTAMLLASVREEFSSAPTGKGTKADIELIKSDIAAAEQMLNDASLNFNEGRYIVAQTKLAAATDRLDRVMSDILAAKKKKAGNPRA